MNAVRFSAMLLVAGTLPALGPIHYAPSVHRYRLHVTIERTEERNGNKRSGVITNEQQVTWALQALNAKTTHTDADTLKFVTTLDSASMSSTWTAQLQDVSMLQGTKVSGVMLPSGKVLSFKADTTSANVVDRESLVSSMAQFLITFPSTAGAGATWTDTANSNVSNNGFTSKSTTITVSKVIGDTTVDGQQAWRVHREFTMSISGTQQQENQLISMEGQGTGEAMYYIGTNGVYLGSTARQSTKSSVKAEGMVIPVTQTANSTVTIIK